MTKLFIIVQTNKSDYNAKKMVTKEAERDVIAYVASISTRSGLDDIIAIDRIFSVNEYGKSSAHTLVFKNGKLFLEEQPEIK